MATASREVPITRLRMIADFEVVNAFLRSVPKAVQHNIAGKVRTIANSTRATIGKNPEPKIVPKVPRRTKSCIQALELTN